MIDPLPRYPGPKETVEHPGFRPGTPQRMRFAGECPLVGDETAEYVCGRCASPIRKMEAVLYP